VSGAPSVTGGFRARSLQIEAILLSIFLFLRMILSEKSVNFSDKIMR
jgi:hypothetical protein